MILRKHNNNKILIGIFHIVVPIFLVTVTGGGNVSVAQSQAPLEFESVNAYVSGTNAVKVEWKLKRAPTSSEGVRVVVLRNGTALSDVKLSTQQSGVSNIQGTVNQPLKVEIRSSSNTIITSKDITIASQPPANQSGTNTGSGDGFQFRDTLFGNVTAPQYIRSLYIWSVGIAILGASIMMIYAGYKYTASRGNPTELSNAKEIIISSLVGLALLILSFTILRFLGVNVRNITAGTNNTQSQTQQTQSQTQTQQNAAPAPANVNPPVDPSNQIQR